jgi:hypothetical protein
LLNKTVRRLELAGAVADFSRAGRDSYYLEVLGEDYERQIDWMAGLVRNL